MVISYSKKIINIHPSLLPKYGGKGMYGKKIYHAVIKNKEAESGITIHYVDEEYDNGDIIIQKKIQIKLGESPQELAERILKLEHKYYPIIIKQFCEQKF